jgi:hypothetical protein
VIQQMEKAMIQSGYRVEKLVELAGKKTTASRAPAKKRVPVRRGKAGQPKRRG